jgi:hypothetical protein
MFMPHCHCFASLFDPCTLSTSFQLASAIAVERELQDRRRKELEQAEAGKKCTCGRCSSERQR